jgi:hypothetical protein
VDLLEKVGLVCPHLHTQPTPLRFTVRGCNATQLVSVSGCGWMCRCGPASAGLSKDGGGQVGQVDLFDHPFGSVL